MRSTDRNPQATASRARRRLAGLIALALVWALAPLAVWLAPPALAATSTAPQIVAGTSVFAAVTCPSVTTCLAVGGSTAGEGAIMPITNGVPGAVQVVSGTSVFQGVACTSTTSCVATGTVGAGTSTRSGVVVPIANGMPGAVQVVPGANQLGRVACPDATTCVTVGTFDTDPSPAVNASVGIVLPITNGSAGVPQQVPGTTQLQGIDCGDASTCLASGALQLNGSIVFEGRVVPITNGVAGPAQAVANPGGETTVFFGVACPTASTCTATGVEENATLTAAQGVLTQVANGVPGALTEVAGTVLLYEVDCATATNCVAVGVAADSFPVDNPIPVVLTIVNGVPGPAHRVSGTGGLLDIACPSTTSCVAVGTTHFSDNTGQGFVITVDPNATSTTLTVAVTGSQSAGSSTPTFSTSTAPPAGVTFNGTITCTTVDSPAVTITPSLGAGSHTINGSSCSGLTLSGPNAGNYDVAYSGGAFTVTSNTLTVAVTGSQTYGSTPTFTTTTTPPSGVVFNGSISCTTVDSPPVTITPTLAAGPHTVNGSSCAGLTLSGANASAYTLAYSGGAFVVNQAISTTAVTSSLNPSQFAQNVTLTATVTPSTAGAGSQSGTVTFKDGTTTLGTAALSNGQAQLTVSTLGVGAHSVTASWPGDANVTGSVSSVLTQTVNKAVTSVVATNGTGLLRRTYTATLTRVHDGAKLSGKTVVFSIAGTTICTATTNANGVATCSVTGVVIGGTYTASFAGDGNYLASQGSAKA